VRASRLAVGVVVTAAVAGGVVWLALPSGEARTPLANDEVPLGTAVVGPRKLVDRRDIDGTLGYAGSSTVAAPAGGTITRLRGEGATVTRGRSLLSIDAKATGWVLYGTRPMYRDLGPGVSDGTDVEQLERNLKALGYDPGTVDTDWTSATTAAVQDFQADRDLDETGTLRKTDIIISDGPARVGAHAAEVGDPARVGAPVTTLTTRTPVVTARLDAGDVGSVHRGDAVSITLPDGSAVDGRVTHVGSVAKAGSDGEAATVALRVGLRGAVRGLDGAPVTLTLSTSGTNARMAVPVTALVATSAGRYAVELAGSRRLVAVTLGTFADGWVEVRGDGLTAGARVVVPR